jgi:hypothetical protein
MYVFVRRAATRLDNLFIPVIVISRQTYGAVPDRTIIAIALSTRLTLSLPLRADYSFLCNLSGMWHYRSWQPLPSWPRLVAVTRNLRPNSCETITIG